jgi:hypothetical protein
LTTSEDEVLYKNIYIPMMRYIMLFTCAKKDSITKIASKSILSPSFWTAWKNVLQSISLSNRHCLKDQLGEWILDAGENRANSKTY